MSSVVLKYQLDPTGQSPINRVEGELHNLPPRNIRVVATDHGAFFTESLQVFDNLTGLPLTKDSQYYASEMYELPTAKYGKEICAIIVITDPTVSNDIRLNYQALGGEFSTSATAVINMLNSLDLDNRPTTWASIANRPSEYPPAMHLHDVGDTYGWEYVVHALERINSAILQGDNASHDFIFRYIDSMTDPARYQVTAQMIKTLLGIDVLSGNNTGDQTKESLGLDQVDNTADANKPVSSAQQTAINAVQSNLNSAVTSITTTLNSKAPTTHTHSSLVNGAATATLGVDGILTANDFQITSDERLKKDWVELHNLIERMALVKSGEYTLITNNRRYIGVPAQALEAVIPTAVGKDEEGNLSVAYGQSALVTAIALCREVLSLRNTIADMAIEIEKLKDQ